MKGGKGAPGYAARPGLDGVKVNLIVTGYICFS
jgi:hypothetical protein